MESFGVSVDVDFDIDLGDNSKKNDIRDAYLDFNSESNHFGGSNQHQIQRQIQTQTYSHKSHKGDYPEMKKSKCGSGSNSNSDSELMQVNPFLQDVIIRKLVSYLDFDTLKNTRCLCKSWNEITRIPFQQRSCVKFQMPSHNLYEDWTSTFQLDNKAQHFLFYLQCFKEHRLPFQPRDDLPFQNFKFVNYRQKPSVSMMFPIRSYDYNRQSPSPSCSYSTPSASSSSSSSSLVARSASDSSYASGSGSGSGSVLYPYFDILTALHNGFPNSIQSLTFVDEEPWTVTKRQSRNHSHNQTQIQNPVRRRSRNRNENEVENNSEIGHPFFLGNHLNLVYPQPWKNWLENFCHLQTLELLEMFRPELEKCIVDLIKLLQSRSSCFKIRKLAICCGNFLEFNLTRERHLHFIKRVALLVSLLPIEDFTLKSHLSAEELPQILQPIASKLKKLCLKRLSHIPNHIQMFQSTESSVFPLLFPKLKHLQIPNVYFYNLDEINQNTPQLTSLKLVYQPMMICTEFAQNNYNHDEGPDLDHHYNQHQHQYPHPHNNPQNLDHGQDQGQGQLNHHHHDQNITIDCAGVRLDFSLVDDLLLKNEKLTRIEWSVDPAANVLNNYQINVSEVCDITLFGIRQVFPNLRSIKLYVTSASDLEMLWDQFDQLEEIVISQDSPYQTRDQDIIGFEPGPGGRNGHSGIRCLKYLRSIKLLNDNSHLTEDCFAFGLLRLPRLRSVEIRRAPRLLERDLECVKHFMARKPNLLKVQVFKD